MIIGLKIENHIRLLDIHSISGVFLRDIQIFHVTLHQCIASGVQCKEID